MNTRVFFLILLISLACNRQEIALGKVSFLPDYFSANIHFGTDLKLIEERNEFILVTGKIDTTSENPPLKLAVISVDNTKIFLALENSSTKNEETTQMYSGNGYLLNLTYSKKEKSSHDSFYEGHLIIKHNNLKSEYNIVGESGYH